MTTTRNAMQEPLPKGWKWVRLGEVCETITGGTPLKDKKEYFENGTIPWLRSGEITQGTIYNSKLFITESGLKNSSAKILPPNSVLVAMYGATAGQVGLLKFESAINQAICGILPNETYLPDFLYRFLSAKTKEFKLLCAGGAQQNLSQTIIKNLKIMLPPLPTQHKIVEILEEADNLRKFRQQADEKMKDLIPSLFVQMFGDPVKNPRGWEVKEIGEICSIKGGKRLPKGAKFSSQVTDFSYIRVTDFKDGSVDTSILMYLDEGIRNQIKRYTINKTDVYISIAGTIGLVGIIPDGLDGANLTENAAKLVVNNSSLVMSEYLARFLQTPAGQSQIKQRTNAVGQPKLALERIATIKIPLPPLPLQQKFVQLVKGIESEKARQAESKKKLDDLFQSLMQQAFTGELVA